MFKCGAELASTILRTMQQVIWIKEYENNC